MDIDTILNEAIISSLRSHILNENRRFNRSTTRGGLSISSRYYNDPPRGGYHVNEEHEYIFTEEDDDIASLVMLDVTTRFGSPGSEVNLKTQRNNKIKEIKYRRVKEASDNECPICLDTLKVNEFQRTLKCTHCFHKKCIDRWFKKDNDCCPMCRTVIINLT